MKRRAWIMRNPPAFSVIRGCDGFRVGDTVEVNGEPCVVVDVAPDGVMSVVARNGVVSVPASEVTLRVTEPGS